MPAYLGEIWEVVLLYLSAAGIKWKCHEVNMISNTASIKEHKPCQLDRCDPAHNFSKPPVRVNALHIQPWRHLQTLKYPLEEVTMFSLCKSVLTLRLQTPFGHMVLTMTDKQKHTLTCRHMSASLSLSWESSALCRSISPSRCLSSSLSSRPEEGPLGSRWNDDNKEQNESDEEQQSVVVVVVGCSWKKWHMDEVRLRGKMTLTHHDTHTSTFLLTFWTLTHTQKQLEPTCIKPSLTSFPPSTPCWRLLIWSLKEITWKGGDKMGKQTTQMNVLSSHQAKASLRHSKSFASDFTSWEDAASWSSNMDTLSRATRSLSRTCEVELASVDWPSWRLQITFRAAFVLLKWICPF